MRSEFRKILFVTSAAMVLAFTAPADTLFDNSTTDLNYRLNPGTQQVGDQIKLLSSGYLTNFAFEYYGTNTANPANTSFAGTVQAQVSIYLMDGPLFNGYATPGKQIYFSSWFTINPTSRATLVYTAGIDFAPGGLLIPSTDITWAVQFRGMGATDTVGVDVYSAPTVGQDFPDYWRNTGSGWVLETNAVPVDFAAKFQGTIPEPSVVSLAIVGGVVMMIAGRKRKV